MALGGFLVSGVKPLSKFLCFTSELHHVLGALFEVFEGRPGFVSYRADAEAGKQRLRGVFPGGFLIQAGEDAGACGANEELTPSYFIGVFPDFPELEPLVQLS